MRTIKEWSTEIHELAKSKGWYDKERSPLELHMLIVSEVAEATEEARKDALPIYVFNPVIRQDVGPTDAGWVDGLKPKGELIELADAVIRVMDYCESRGWDLEQAIQIKHEYNETRPHRHGGKLY